MIEEAIRVTQPSLPPLEEYAEIVAEIWDNRILTNAGPIHGRLESALRERLGVPNVSLFNNGTTALMTALRALDLEGEVITTPYSFVATAHALLWNNLTPVFVDVEPDTLNIDPARIEAGITPRTRAILAVHCYGFPCDVDAVGGMASEHGLKVIYDAAHSFGVQCRGESVLMQGDLSILSFHATKVFNTGEGGAIICHDAETKRRIERLRNFGIRDEDTIEDIGLNGKMSELNAALGIAQLKYVDDMIAKRREVDLTYRESLRDVNGVRCLSSSTVSRSNFAYFPVIIEDVYPLSRDGLYRRLRARGINARRYFHPLLSDLPMYRELPSATRNKLRVAAGAAERVLCLPMYAELSREEQMKVVEVVRESA